MSIEAAIRDWKELLGVEYVLDERSSQERYGRDTSGTSRHIPCALLIKDGSALPDLVRIAQKHRTPIYPISTGRNWGYGSALPAQDGCVIVDLSGMNRILHFDAELGVVTVEPGVTQGMLADFLDAGGHDFLVPVTGAGPSVSLLGNALERGYGVTPYTDHFSAVTDIEAVLPDGRIYRTAMAELGCPEIARLFKWGIGPYTAGLFTQGNFGIVTRMSILLARRPESVKVCFFGLKDDALLEPAVAQVRSLLSKLPGTIGAINLMNRHRVLAMTAPYPADGIDADGLISAAKLAELGKQYQVLPWTGFMTLYGTKSIVKAAQKEVRHALGPVASRLMFFSQAQARSLAGMARLIPGVLGQRLASTAGTLAQSLELVNGRPNETALPLAYWRSPAAQKSAPLNPARDACGLLWYAPLVPMRAESVRAYVSMVTDVCRSHRIEPLITLTSLGERLFDSTVPILFDRTSTQKGQEARACRESLLHEGASLGFHPYRLAQEQMPSYTERCPEASGVGGRLKMSLDPGNVLAPGRYAKQRL